MLSEILKYLLRVYPFPVKVSNHLIDTQNLLIITPDHLSVLTHLGIHRDNGKRISDTIIQNCKLRNILLNLPGCYYLLLFKDSFSGNIPPLGDGSNRTLPLSIIDGGIIPELFYLPGRVR